MTSTADPISSPRAIRLRNCLHRHERGVGKALDREGRMVRGASLPQARDPRQLTTWQHRLTSRRIPAYESRVLPTPSYPSLRSRFRLHERVELAGGKDGIALLGEI
jgi:hypothetical protein